MFLNPSLLSISLITCELLCSSGFACENTHHGVGCEKDGAIHSKATADLHFVGSTKTVVLALTGIPGACLAYVTFLPYTEDLFTSE